MAKVRIQKFLAEVGVASRRAVEEMILQGRITVNGKLVLSLPCFVEPGEDDIRLDGKPVRRRLPQRVYFLLNKPRGVVCTQRDPQGRPTAAELVPQGPQRVYAVFGLDAESTGLVMLTNDGELTRYLTDSRRAVPKTYVLHAEGNVSGESIEAIKKGVHLDGRRTSRAMLKVLARSAHETVMEIRLAETHSRQLRRVLAKLGHKVRRLKRTAIGPISERGLKIGHYRPLTGREVEQIRSASIGEGRG